MEKEEKLAILKMYLAGRSIGHTTAMLEGAKHSAHAIVLVKEIHEEHYISQMAQKKIRVVSWNNIEALRGLRAPLLIDNNAMSAILGDALSLLVEKRAENSLLSMEIRDYKNYTDELREENRKLYAEIEQLKKRKGILQRTIDKLKSKKNSSPGRK